MSLDGMAVRALAHELNHELCGGRVEKVSQPNKSTIILHIRNNGITHRLLSSTNAQNVRLALTEENYVNPLEPPLFCMVLRKHLQGAKIKEIYQLNWERIIKITFVGRNEIGEETNITLQNELMGKFSNLVLLDDHNKILDAMRRVGAGTNLYRQIQPGLDYIDPPPQNKYNPDDLTEEQLINILSQEDTIMPINKLILSKIAGLGPQTIAEILHISQVDPKASVNYLGLIDYQHIFQALNDLISQVKNACKPTLIIENNAPIAFAPFKLSIYSNHYSISYPTLSKLLEDYYGKKETNERFSQKQESLIRIISSEIMRCEKKLSLQLNKIEDASNAEKYRIYGELITANLYRIKSEKIVCLPNFYSSNNEELSIPMDILKSPNENAQKYFKLYNKAKNSAKKAQIQANQTQEELLYLNDVLSDLRQSDHLDDLNDIKKELKSSLYIKDKVVQKKQNKHSKKESNPNHLSLLIDDFTLYVGKNNIQNDYVTTKLARGKDLWLHTKNIHGAHVIIKNNGTAFSDKVIQQAAQLSAWFSKARFSSQVPVDMTYKKYVHKPNGARQGLVTYTNQKTIYVTPNEEEIKIILQKHEV